MSNLEKYLAEVENTLAPLSVRGHVPTLVAIVRIMNKWLPYAAMCGDRRAVDELAREAITPDERIAMTDIFSSCMAITAIKGIPHGEYGEALSYVVGEEGVVAIEPCRVAGSSGDMTWFRATFEDGSDAIISPWDVSEILRGKPE
jgi:hypothetical protein